MTDLYAITHSILRERCDSDASDLFYTYFTNSVHYTRPIDQLLQMLQYWTQCGLVSHLNEHPLMYELTRWNTIEKYTVGLGTMIIPLLENGELKMLEVAS